MDKENIFVYLKVVFITSNNKKQMLAFPAKEEQVLGQL